jgi:lipopolysaccharide export LptBFGC system permease protein LptF
MIAYFSIILNLVLIAVMFYREDTMRNRLRAKLAKQAERFNESTNKWQLLLNGANEDFEKIINDLKKSRNELYELYMAAMKENRDRKIRHAAAQAKHRAKKQAEREAAQAAEVKSKKAGKKEEKK